MSKQQHVLVTGAGKYTRALGTTAGFIGQLLAAALLESSAELQLTLTDVIEPPIPSAVAQHATRITTTQSDLTDTQAISSLLSTRFTAVYLLHGLMSGAAEAQYELGWKVNWESHRAILDHLRIHNPGVVTIFTSSLAVYGPASPKEVTTEMTGPMPMTNYGSQKLMVETYLNNLSRKRLIDGRIVRLPTVIVRPGAPSAAASSFASGIVREPLKGERSALPVPRDLEMWVCSPQTVVKNLVLVKDVEDYVFGITRSVNLPGIKVTVQDILDALEAVGGKEAISLIDESPDPKVSGIVETWPANFNTSYAKGLGMQPDVPLVDTVRAFADSLKL
ncbi:D-erythronate dehydrogenase [Apiospora kogelbergensis]|uniref:D-erythronate dehydrogenase n=1 Tax=Apiospora kogelbergensis TaxID=1337665 RepID=UPI00312D6DE7